MSYAVIKLGVKQIKVSEGDVFTLDRQEKLHKPEVLLFSDGKSLKIGTPTVEDVIVTLSKVEDKLDEKVRVARFKSKVRYRKVKGHRQPLTSIKVEKIAIKGSLDAKQTEEKTDIVEKSTRSTVGTTKKPITTRKTGGKEAKKLDRGKKE